jgi:hypothetical protein
MISLSAPTEWRRRDAACLRMIKPHQIFRTIAPVYRFANSREPRRLFHMFGFKEGWVFADFPIPHNGHHDVARQKIVSRLDIFGNSFPQGFPYFTALNVLIEIIGILSPYDCSA